MILSIILLLAGLAILIFGAESLVRGASSLSKKIGIPPIVIGLTVVAFGTSAPELIINVLSALKGSTDLALGNVVGSNISNILLVLGISAIIINLKVNKSTTWKEIPFSLLAILVLLIMTNDVFFDGSDGNIISRVEGIVFIGFFGIFLFYTASLLQNSTSSSSETGPEIATYSNPLAIGMTILGFAMLFLGGQLLVDNAVELARIAGMSEILIGLTIIAIGTSLPELATSITAAFKKQNDLAIGNIVGSNIFNIFWILGVTSIIKPIPITQDANIDILVCVFATIILFAALFIGKKQELQRWQGVLMILSYVVYLTYLIIRG